MVSRSKLPEFHEPVVGRAHDFTWRLEREWSCPLHDDDANEYFDESGEEYDIVCLGCLAAGWKTKYDEDGWATLIFTEKDAFTKAMIAYYLPTIKDNLNSDLSLHLKVHRDMEARIECQ